MMAILNLRKNYLLGAIAFIALFVLGCSDDTPKSPYYYYDSGLDGNLVTDVKIIQDLPPEPDTIKNAAGPTITILYPAENDVVIDDTIKVRAEITDPDGVDDQSVFVTLQSVGEQIAMGLTTTPNVYEAIIDVSALDGQDRLIVEATDLSTDTANDCPCSNSAVRTFTFDPGPKITFLSPGADDDRFKSSLTLRVQVVDIKEITDFKVMIGSKVLTLNKTTIKDEANAKIFLYDATIKFDDPLFDLPLAGTQVLRATAANVDGAQSEESRTFIIDNEGPLIAPTSPTLGQLIGGVLKVEADVSDEAGVVESTVIAIIGNNLTSRKVPLSRIPNTNTYEGQFDTSTLSADILYPVISFRAADLLGNESTFDYEIAVDNGAPIVSLDPPINYYFRMKEDGLYKCSYPIDPVGDDAASDGEEVPQIVTIRARIQDQGNGSAVPSAEFTLIKGVDAATTTLYVLDDTTKPLVVDTDGDGYCDSLNTDVIPLSGASALPGQAVAVDLVGVPGGGDTPYKAPLLAPALPWSGFPSTPPSFCTTWGSDQDIPEPLCDVTDPPKTGTGYSGRVTRPLSVVIMHDNGDPALFVPGPVMPGDNYRCAGLPFDFKANSITPGWTCMVAVARDGSGLLGVSEPMRLFYNELLPVYLKGQMATTTPPNCTGTTDSTGTVTNTPCIFRQPGDLFPQVFSDTHVFTQ